LNLPFEAPWNTFEVAFPGAPLQFSPPEISELAAWVWHHGPMVDRGFKPTMMSSIMVKNGQFNAV
jgi:hypothetical protein